MERYAAGWGKKKQSWKWVCHHSAKQKSVETVLPRFWWAEENKKSTKHRQNKLSYKQQLWNGFAISLQGKNKTDVEHGFVVILLGIKHKIWKWVCNVYVGQTKRQVFERGYAVIMLDKTKNCFENWCATILLSNTKLANFENGFATILLGKTHVVVVVLWVCHDSAGQENIYNMNMGVSRFCWWQNYKNLKYVCCKYAGQHKQCIQTLRFGLLRSYWATQAMYMFWKWVCRESAWQKHIHTQIENMFATYYYVIFCYIILYSILYYIMLYTVTVTITITTTIALYSILPLYEICTNIILLLYCNLRELVKLTSSWPPGACGR